MPSLSYLAIVLGAMIFVSRTPGIFYPKQYSKVLKSVLNEDMMRFFSVVPLLISISILLQKYNFTRDWETVMSVLGWVMLAGSLVLAWYPEFVIKRAHRVLKSESKITMFTFLGSLFGIALMYLGFFIY